MSIPLIRSESISLPSITVVDETVPDYVLEHFNIRRIGEIKSENNPYLALVKGEVVIIAPDLKLGPIKADWQRMTRKWRTSDPIIKATRKISGSIVDLTAGLGGDAGLMAVAGHEVILVERNPLLASLLALSLAALRFSENDAAPQWISRLGPVYLMDAMEFLDKKCTKETGFYFDPMYEKNTRKRLTRGSMQLVQQIAQANDEEAKAVCTRVLELGKGRLIVKRAPKAKSLLESCDYTVEGKNVRLDVYMPRRRS